MHERVQLSGVLRGHFFEQCDPVTVDIVTQLHWNELPDELSVHIMLLPVMLKCVSVGACAKVRGSRLVIALLLMLSDASCGILTSAYAGK